MNYQEILPVLLDGAVVRTVREGARLTQTGLANEAGLSQCYLSRIEAGDVKMPPETAHKVWLAIWKLDKEYRPPSIQLGE
jgi:transcriptional regulator with XRE-family HTH domain